jgi:DNA-binding MarR family transcriptional regulator
MIGAAQTFIGPVPRMARPKRTARPAAVSAPFHMPRTVSRPDLLSGGSDEPFRQTLYLMVLAFGRLIACREAFGRVMSLTGSQFAVMVGTAYRQKSDGVSIRELSEHVQLASTHVTTEVGRLIRKGLLIKRANTRDRRGVLVKLSRKGETALLQVAPFVRAINDLLFENVERKDFAAVTRFLGLFAENSERAMTEIKRARRDAKSLGTAAG